MSPISINGFRAGHLLRVATILLLSAGAAWAQSTPRGSQAPVAEVQSFRPTPATQSLTLAAKPEWIVGGELQRIDDELDPAIGGRAAVALRNGFTLLADGTRLLRISQRGEIVARYGRLGSGPQEFRDIPALCAIRGDSVVVCDGGNQRIALVGPTGRVVRTYPFGPDGMVPSTGCYSDGTVARMTVVPFRVATQSMLIVKRSHIDRPAVLDSILIGPTNDATTISAQRAAVAIGLRSLVSDGQQPGLSIYDESNHLMAHWNVRQTLEVMSESDKMRCALMGVPKSYPPAQRDASVRRRLERSQQRYWPTHGTLLADDQGRTWVQTSPRCDKKALGWHVLDRDGALAATFSLRLPADVQFPDDVSVLFVARGRMLLSWLDTNGARVVSLWPIVPQ